MNDLQTIAFEPPAYDPVADRNNSKEKLKEIVKEKEPGRRKQDFIEAALRLSELKKAETSDPVQDGQQ